MTIPFKTFSKHLTEKASANVSVFDGAVADKGRIFSAGDLASFGAAGWGGSSSNPKDNPMYKYFATNISNANIKTKLTLNLLRATPGLMSDVLGDGDGSLDNDGGNETGGLPSFILPGDDGEEGELGGDVIGGSVSGGGSVSDGGSVSGGGGYSGMTTDALYFGDPGDDETKKNIYRAALAHQKDAQARWKQLKTWVTSFGVDPKIQSKITSSTTVLGVNTPSVMKNLKKGKE
jgi:hypothetical protein